MENIQSRLKDRSNNILENLEYFEKVIKQFSEKISLSLTAEINFYFVEMAAVLLKVNIWLLSIALH